MNDTKRHVLNTLLTQTNDHQTEWTSRRSLFTTTVAHTARSAEEVQVALDGFADDGLIEDQGERYRPANDAERVLHPGEITSRD